MMNANQKKFIILRSDGLSFDKIAKELKVSKSTLLSWNKLFIADIQDMQFQSMLAIKEEYSYNQVEKYKTLMKHLKKFDDGIANANFSEEKIKDILTSRNNIAYQLEQMETKVIYTNTNLTTKCDIMGTVSSVTMKLKEI